jgi:hypothetical protein
MTDKELKIRKVEVVDIAEPKVYYHIKIIYILLIT